MLLSCKRFMRLLNAKIAKAEEDRKIANEERQRVDELSLRERQQERQRVDELSFRERQLEADTALKEQEMASKERIELERIRSTAATTQDCRNDTSLSAMTTQNDPSSSSSSDNYRVFLQSATVLLRNKSTNRNIEAHIVFDSGATASYITESMVKKLGLKCDYSRDVNVYTFGDIQPKTIPMYITKVELIDKVGRAYEVTVNQIPTIAGSVSNSVCPKIIENLSRTYELADKYLTKPGNQTYDILIGNDYYTSFMRNNTIQVNEHLYLLDSIFGYLLSGKVHYDTPKEGTPLFVHLDRSHEHDLLCNVKENETLTDDDLTLQNDLTAIRYGNDRYSQSIQPWRERRRDVRWQSRKVIKKVPKVGDMVLVRQPKLKNRERWPHGKVIKLYYGRDKEVRHVDVQLQNGVVISRFVSWLYTFDCGDD
ncbi:hypothetical protein WDU94_015508 [Cyamophila willieti]